MRWKDKPNASQEGQERVVTKFLFLPLRDKEQVRWLERADILERVIKQDVGGSYQWGKYRWNWVKVSFANG